MSSISSIDTIKPPPSPSLSSSPTLEDDLAHTRPWLAHDSPTPSPDRKGKSKQQHPDPHEDSAELSDSNTSYPPVSDQEAETRRVEETLRRWEIAERQRRKTARGESISSAPVRVASPSLFSDVTRRASLLWSGGRKRNASIGGKHSALTSTDNLDVVPLEDINASPTQSPSLSPTPPAQPWNSEPEGAAADDTPENPFENPTTPTALKALSPFADTHGVDTADGAQKSQNAQSFLHPSTGDRRRSRHPPPMPLDLPRPKTPPPPTMLTPPYPTSPPDLTRNGQGGDNSEKPVRWWHEWLCGCGEGTDRGGEYQAGRTNPFE